jgi:hypothetical protein
LSHASIDRRRAGVSCAVLSVVLLAAGAAGCAITVPKPPTGRLPADALIEVPYPPPPGRVEVVPPRNSEDEVWVDGQWDWNGKDWKWTDGAWVKPPPNAYFTRWKAVRASNGQLFFARAAWR